MARLIAADTRDPAPIIGGVQARAEATRVAECQILRLVGKRGHPCIGPPYSPAYGTTFSAVAAGLKTVFPGPPLNSEF